MAAFVNHNFNFNLPSPLLPGFFLEMSFRGEIALVRRENLKNIQLAA